MAPHFKSEIDCRVEALHITEKVGKLGKQAPQEAQDVIDVPAPMDVILNGIMSRAEQFLFKLHCEQLAK